MKKIRVIIADDMKIFVELIKNILEKNENIIVVDTLSNGKELYEKIIEDKPDVVFTDNDMPFLKGIEVIEKINKEGNIVKKPKFVLVTGQLDYKKMEIINRNEAKALLKSMINEEEVLRIIEDFSYSNSEMIEKVNIKRKKRFFLERFIKI